MKSVWVGIALFFVYGLFSIKSQAAEMVLTVHAEFAQIECK
jgi:hypothetical protein